MASREHFGWLVSVALHVGVVAAFALGLPSFSLSRPAPPPPIAVEFVKIADQTRVVEPEPEEETQAVQERQVAARAEPVAAEPEAAVPLPNASKPVPEVKAPPPKPVLSETQKLAARVRPRSKPKPPSRLKSSRVAALIDRSIKEEKAPSRTEPKKEDAKKAKEDPFSGLRGTIATASLRDALSQKLAGCWNFPGGAKGITDMAVTVRIWLAPDGRLSRSPEFVEAGDMNDGFYRTFAESARRAVVLCEPFTEASEYIATGRKYIDFNFNGAEFGGR